ncbi:MAG: YaeQ family protein [Thiohalomonadales bacterium]
MALKPTIYKLRIALSDINRNYYDTLNITVAQHPSETIERMMARVLVYCINTQEGLVFTKGLSAVEQPDIWVRTLDDTISLWIDVGEPSVDRIKKAAQQASAVRVYSFNSKSDVWWAQASQKISKLGASIFRLEWQEIKVLATLVQRSMDFSVTITGDSAYIATELGECELAWVSLQER